MSQQYSPDGRWWWDGRQWVPVGGPPPPRPRSGVPGWLWAVGALAIVVVLAAAIGGYLLLRPSTGPGATGWGTPATVSAALAGRGLTCGQSLVLQPATTICQREQGGRTITAGVTTGGFAVQARAQARNLDPNDTSSTTAFAKPLFETLVATASDAADRQAAVGWLDLNLGASAHTTMGRLDILLNTNGGTSSILVTVSDAGGGRPTPPSGTALPNVTTDAARAYFSGIGLSCDALDQGIEFCSVDPPDYYAEAAADPDDVGGSGLRELHYTVITSPANFTRLVDSHMNDAAPGMVGLVLTDPSDRGQVVSWLHAQLPATGKFHVKVVKGIQLQLVPFNGHQTNGQPAVGWRLDVDVAAFPS